MNILVLLLVILGLLAVLALLVFWVIALFDCATWPLSAYESAGTTKTSAALLVGFSGPAGAAIYWTRIRPKLSATRTSTGNPEDA